MIARSTRIGACFLIIGCLLLLSLLLKPTPTQAMPNPQQVGTLRVTALPAFSHNGGFYTSTFQLELSTTVAGAGIYYTTDGSEPTTDSLPYSSPISIDSRAGDPNVLSLIRTTDHFNEWNEPEGEVFKGTTIRARIITEDGAMGPIVTQTYFVDPAGANRYSLPVVSVVSDADNFFDPDIGIYVPGSGYDSADPNDSPNYAKDGREWERPVHIELFDNGERILAQDAGVRIHGNFTTRFQSKSLRFYARSEYGPNTFYARLFPDRPFTEYKTFILRNAGQDWDYAHFRDALMHRLVEHLPVETQAFRPVVVFLNGEYWGLLNMRERQDNQYLETHYGIPNDKVDMLEMPDDVSEGSDEHYRSMLRYIEENGLADPEHYAYIQTQMDVDNYIDYNIIEMFGRNTDWPHTNVENWRYQSGGYDPDAPFGFDGRWRWFVHDMDHGMGQNKNDPFARNLLTWATAPDGNGYGEWATFLLRSLLENETFRIQFINRFADHLNTTFLPERTLSVIEEIVGVLAVEMPEHIRRYGQPASMEAWESEVDVVRHFFQVRPDFQREHIIEYFNLGGTANVELNVSNPNAGTIRINTIRITENTVGISDDASRQPYPWQGIYFQDVPVTITAMPRFNYRFVGWEGLPDAELASDETVEIVLSEDLSLTARFESIVRPGPRHRPFIPR